MAQGTSPVNVESPFRLEELFFSTTDTRGYITFGNNVFVRVSKFSREELMGQPHNIIRHPDMPHCIFRILWNRIQQGKSIGAYVKNMAKDGTFYWVMAYVVPIPGAYLSIRLKPSTALFQQVKGVYETLRQEEQKADESGLSRVKSMDAADEKLAGILTTLGMRDYEELMHEMVVAEVRSRKESLKHTRNGWQGDVFHHTGDLGSRQELCARLGHHLAHLNETMKAFLELEKSLRESLKFTNSFGSTLHRLTLNGRILSTALGEKARALAEVARQMNSVSLDVAKSSTSLGKTMTEVLGYLKQASSEIASSELSVEMMDVFMRELAEDQADMEVVRENIDKLAAVVAGRFRATSHAIGRAFEQLVAFDQMLESFISTIQTLDILYVSGRIESVRVQNAQDFGEVLQETVKASGEAQDRAGRLNRLVGDVRSRLEQESSNLRLAMNALG